VLLLCAAPAFAAKDQAGVVARIPLGPLGYPPRLANRMMSGNAMFTLNYVDSTHLLFTFTKHELLRRIPDDPADDEDRNVGAVLLEIPSGKVLAQTTWRLHDYAQYLWSLGGGRFLLRRRNELTTFAPLASAGDPFAEQPMLKLAPELTITDIGLSFDRGVLVLEVSPKPRPPGPGQKAFGRDDRPAVAVQFIRLLPWTNAADPIQFRLDTAVERRAPTEFSLTTAGFMMVRRESPFRWGFDYREYNGRELRLAGLESSCPPFPVFVSGSEFVSFGCRGSDYKSSLTGFSLKGDVAWQMTFSEPQGYSTMAAAPEAGRFAISRSLAGGFAAPAMPSQIIEQEVRVLQSYDGRQLLKVDCSPVQASGQNFAIAPDGMSLAVMQDAIVVYALPPLSEADRKAVAAAQELTPKVPLEAKVNLSGGPPELPRQPPPALPAPAAGAAGAAGNVAGRGPGTGGQAAPDSALLLQGNNTQDDLPPTTQRRPSLYLPE
jgi:hypothetical protein